MSENTATHRVVAGPSKLGSVRVDAVVLEVDVLRAVRWAKGNLSCLASLQWVDIHAMRIDSTARTFDETTHFPIKFIMSTIPEIVSGFIYVGE